MFTFHSKSEEAQKLADRESLQVESSVLHVIINIVIVLIYLILFPLLHITCVNCALHDA